MSTPLRERPDAPLGTLIFRAGLLPAETIENALEEGVKTGRRLGEILIERGLLEEEDLTRLLAGQKGLPFVSLRAEPIDPEATRLLSEDQARLFSALPIRFEEGLPLVAVADPTNDVLNRNIREALGQDARFVVAGRTELNEVIGDTYSGVLRTVAPPPAAETPAETEAEEPVGAPSLRVDTSIPPAAEEPPAPVHDSGPESAPALEAETETEAEIETEPAPEPELEPEETFELAAPELAFEAPVPEAAPAPELQAPAPAFDTAPEPEAEPVASFEASAPATEFEPPAPAYEAPAPEPVAPVAAEPPPDGLPLTNGHLPHDVETDHLPVAATPPAPEQVASPAPEPEAPEPGAPAAAPSDVGFTVFVRLTSGERLTVAQCADLGEAKGYAKALTKQLGTTDPDDWPFVNGRFLKPDTIVSVDVEGG